MAGFYNRQDKEAGEFSPDHDVMRCDVMAAARVQSETVGSKAEIPWAGLVIVVVFVVACEVRELFALGCEFSEVVLWKW